MVRCLGCGAVMPEHDGPVHAYMLSSPGCWALYGSVLAWKDSVTAGDGTTAQRIVEDWATSAWAAWSAHHDMIRAWLAISPDR